VRKEEERNADGKNKSERKGIRYNGGNEINA
jgi:hypothetical protein